MRGTSYTLSPGSFTVAETGGPSGYVASFSGDCDTAGAVTIAAGDNKTCTVTNTFQAPTTGTLKVVKHVVNTGGGTASAGDWQLHVTTGGVDVTGSPAAGSETGTSYTLSTGAFSVSENGGPSGARRGCGRPRLVRALAVQP
jgi:hypothetical protein